MTGAKSLPAMVLLATGGTGMVFSGTLKIQETPVALKRILKSNFDEKMVHEKIMHHLLIKV